MISNFILNHDLRRTDLLNRLRGLTNLMKRLFRGSLCPDRERLGLVVILQNLSEFKSGAGTEAWSGDGSRAGSRDGSGDGSRDGSGAEGGAELSSSS